MTKRQRSRPRRRRWNGLRRRSQHRCWPVPPHEGSRGHVALRPAATLQRDRYTSKARRDRRGNPAEGVGAAAGGKAGAGECDAQAIAAFRDERFTECSPATVVRDLAVLSSILNHARREWGINFPNHVQMVRKPASPPGRDRVLSSDEEVRLIVAAAPAGRRNRFLQPLLIVALETAIRRGELLTLRWGHVHLNRRCAYLHNGRTLYVVCQRKLDRTCLGMERARGRGVSL